MVLQTAQYKQRQRGAAAVLAMLFLVLGTTLTVAMYQLSTVNTQSAHNLSDVARAQSAAEAGLRWMNYRFAHLDRPWTTKGNIDAATADTLWKGADGLQQKIIDDMQTLTNPAERPTAPAIHGGTSVSTSWISMEEDGARFQVRVAQDTADQRFLEVISIGQFRDARRFASMSFRIDKKINFAVVGKVPIQLGRNTIVEGPVAMATANKFPPLLMLSDFMHFDTTLANQLATWNTFLQAHHNGYDNRVSVDNPVEYDAATAAGYTDYNGDAYIDEFDLFLKRFNTDTSVDDRGVQYISQAEFTNALTGQLYEKDLFALLDSIGGPLAAGDTTRAGYKDNRINFDEGYGKVRGNVELASTANAWSSWLDGQHSGGSYTTYNDINDFIQGTIMPTTPGTVPAQFGVPPETMIDLDPSNFEECANNFKNQSGSAGGASINTGTVKANVILSASMANGGNVYEESPKGSKNFQAVYKRPVFKNMTLRNVQIPKGLNALFDNCKFEQVTWVDDEHDITTSSGAITYDKNEGMNWAKRKTTGSGSINTGGEFKDTNGDGKWDQYKITGMGSASFVNLVDVDGDGIKDFPTTGAGSYSFGSGTADLKTKGSTKGNNLRFNNCTFEGPIAGSYATAYTHFANSWEFTGQTMFNNVADQTATIVSPQVNIEMGSFNTPGTSPSTLSGVVVAGNIDIRGSSNVDGSIIITGDGAGNTTLAYFGATDASTDPNAPMPEGGWGKLLLRYNPNRALPDGINLPIQLDPQIDTYSEAVK